MTNPTPKEKSWVDFPLEQYQQEASRLIHFSSKTVNSNAPPCGVRVGADAAIDDLPLVSVRTLLACKVAMPLDYTRNAGKTATVVKQLRLAQSAETPLDATEAHTRDICRMAEQATKATYEEGTDWVSPRLRQVLLPRDDGGYVAVSPLGSSGLSALLQQKLEAWPDADRFFRRAMLGVGGSNPQNVGALVRDMRTPLLFRAPTENPQLRQALSIHFRGISLRLPRQPMENYRTQRERWIAQGGGEMPSDMRIRQREAELIQAVARVILQRGEWARELLVAHCKDLPVASDAESLLSPEVSDEVIRGLIEPHTRSAQWAYDFGKRIAEGMASYRFGTDGARMFLGDSAIGQIARWIEEFAR